MKTVLVISGGGFQGLGLIRALQQLDDTRVIVCDVFSENVTRYICPDYVVAPPLAQHDAFASFLLELVRREKVSIVFPATARELMVLSQLREDLRELGAVTAVSGHHLLTTLLDKQRTYEWVHANKLPALALIDPTRFDFESPLFGRPRNGWGGRGAVVLQHPQDIVTLDGDPSQYIWTRWLAEFDEFSADFAIAGPEQISMIVLRQRIRTSGGFAVISVSKFDSALEKLALESAQALAAAGGLGLFNVQMLAPTGSQPVISDINPRIGTSATHSLAEGINLPGFLMGITHRGAGPAPKQLRKNVRTVRLLNDLVIPQIGRPRGIVFDLDDTLVDHKLWMLQKIEATYEIFFHQHESKDTFLSFASSLIDEGVRADLIDKLLIELQLPNSLRTQAIEAYRAATVPNTPLFPDVAPTLRALKAEGFPLAILTDNPPVTQRAKIAHAETLSCFDAVVYAREHGAEKPNASGFLEASRKLSVDPAQLVMVGDNYFRDGIGATRSGYMHALIVRRQGTFLNHHQGLTNALSIGDTTRIDMIDNLLSVFHACTQP
jgi:HAD superfamily hydrolase (TIGR01549 family)